MGRSDTDIERTLQAVERELRRQIGTAANRIDFEAVATAAFDEVSSQFPATRNAQSTHLTALAGDTLMRGDRAGWAVLMRAAEQIKGADGDPEVRATLDRVDAAMGGKVER